MVTISSLLLSLDQVYHKYYYMYINRTELLVELMMIWFSISNLITLPSFLRWTHTRKRARGGASAMAIALRPPMTTTSCSFGVILLPALVWGVSSLSSWSGGKSPGTSISSAIPSVLPLPLPLPFPWLSPFCSQTTSLTANLFPALALALAFSSMGSLSCLTPFVCSASVTGKVFLAYFLHD